MSAAARERLRQLFLERAVLFGDFTLASGKKSKYYINSKRVLFHAEAITLLGELLHDATRDLEFQAIGGLRGVGWVVLCEDPTTRHLSNHWVGLHQDGAPAGFKPLLVMDVWEHAFMRDYRATERGRYLDAFFRNIDWSVVERRLVEPMATRPAAAA